MEVPPHPHTGLQTVTWLLDGEILHRDSLGNGQPIRPGQLNLMTSGRGIAHSEQSPADHPPLMHGLQLWVALPDRPGTVPGFDHHADLPALARRRPDRHRGRRRARRRALPRPGAHPAARRADGAAGRAPARLPLRPGLRVRLLAMSGAAEAAGVALSTPARCSTWAGPDRLTCAAGRAPGCCCSAANRSTSRW